jgi:cyclopropane fatty-acyl-phospholipid synthase-like methyltransferase
MRDWYAYWNENPKHYGELEFFKQVGKTVGGMPIANSLLRIITSEIIEKLSLCGEDRVLDLCCGNGLVSAGISDHCAQLVCIDFSETLIDIARKHHPRKNIEYFCRSILEPAFYSELADRRINKILMYEALQNLRVEDLSFLLGMAKKMLPEDGVVLLGSIPNVSKLWCFYDTSERKAEYFQRVANGTEAIGTWWDQGHLREICENHGFQAEILSQNGALHTAHYRFDALIRNRC